jgi:predicted transcriptional regulator
MDYSRLSLPELKVIARTRRIKQYYILKKNVLINLLTMPELPQSYILEKRTVKSLRDQAKAQGIVRYSKMSRDTLIARLFRTQDVGDTTSHEDEEDQGKAEEHHNPQKHNAQDVRVHNVKDPLQDGR